MAQRTMRIIQKAGWGMFRAVPSVAFLKLVGGSLS